MKSTTTIISTIILLSGTSQASEVTYPSGATTTVYRVDESTQHTSSVWSNAVQKTVKNAPTGTVNQVVDTSVTGHVSRVSNSGVVNTNTPPSVKKG